jgi:hypothetical protein
MRKFLAAGCSDARPRHVGVQRGRLFEWKPIKGAQSFSPNPATLSGQGHRVSLWRSAPPAARTTVRFIQRWSEVSIKTLPRLHRRRVRREML